MYLRRTDCAFEGGEEEAFTLSGGGLGLFFLGDLVLGRSLLGLQLFHCFLPFSTFASFTYPVISVPHHTTCFQSSSFA